jgi:hypothetical protein
MEPEVLEITSSLLEGIGVASNQPAIEATGIFLSALSRGIEMLNQPDETTQASTELRVSTGDSNVLPVDADKWQSLETHLQDFQNTATDVNGTQVGGNTFTDQGASVVIPEDVGHALEHSNIHHHAPTDSTLHGYPFGHII